MKKLNICFATEDFYPNFIGGQGVYGYHLVRNLAKLGHHVSVLAEKRKGRGEFWAGYKNIKLILVPFCFGNQLILAFTEYFAFLIKLRDERFDIVHANQLSGLLFVLFKPKNVKKVVVFEWNRYAEKQQVTESIFKKVLYLPLIYLEKLLYSRADGIIFDSPKEMDNFANFLKVNKPQAGIYLGQEKVRFSAMEKNMARINLRKRLHLPENAKIVLYVGRLVQRKRVDTLIKALGYYPRKSSTSSSLSDLGVEDLRLRPEGASPYKPVRTGVYGVIVGDGRERKKLEKMAPANVKFLGWTYEPRQYYLGSDLFVTVSEAEGGFLITALEAASFSLPLILSASAAGFPIIKEEENGYIADPDDPQELAKKINMVIHRLRSGQVGKMGEESRKLIRQFSWEKCVGETIKFYQLVFLKSK